MEEVKSETIRLSSDFKDWLEGQGKKGETFEDVLRRLLRYPDHKQPA